MISVLKWCVMIQLYICGKHYAFSSVLHFRINELFIQRSPNYVVRRTFCGRVCDSHIPLNTSQARGSYGGCQRYRLIEYSLGIWIIETGEKNDVFLLLIRSSWGELSPVILTFTLRAGFKQSEPQIINTIIKYLFKLPDALITLYWSRIGGLL